MLYYLLIVVFSIGLIMGSFLNCFIWRVYKKESLWNRSYCPKCRKKISWYDNVPILSYLFLKGRCRNCKKSISLQYPVVELIMALLFTIAFYLRWKQVELTIFNGYLVDKEFVHFILSITKDWFVIFVSVAILIYDWRWYIIPDLIMLPSLFLVVMINLLLGLNPIMTVYAIFVGAGFFLVQFLVSKGRWMGGGDVRFGAFMGAVFVAFDQLILAILLAYWFGSIIGIILILKKKKEWQSKLPLGIFLSLGTILTLFFGEIIIEWYFSLI